MKKNLQSFLEDNQLQFDTHHLVRVCVTSFLFLVSCIGNLLVLFSATLWRSNKDINCWQLLVINLSTANIFFTLFVLPIDAIWHITLQWIGGDFMCRLMNALKQFSMYASSSMIVIMEIDKAISIIILKSYGVNHMLYVKVLLASAWLLSTVSAVPALVMFSVITVWVNKCECPNDVVIQCVDYGLIPRLNRRIFYFYSLFISFFIPLLIILSCYVIIVINIRKLTQSRAEQKESSRQRLEKVRRRSQLATCIISLTFLVSWGPYYIIGLHDWFQVNRVNKMVKTIMLMTSYLNPCLHPLIMIVAMKNVRKNIANA